MIRRVRGRHFSCHDAIDVTLGRVTTIVGPSGSGKSAFIRLLKWIAFNRPQGMSFLGKWRTAKSASGTIEVGSHVISRRRGPHVNTYTLDGEKLKAFGAKVPQPVADILNLGPQNFQGQIDPPFLFTATPPQVSKELNKIVNLSAMDRAQQIAARRVRKAKLAVEVSKERLDDAKATVQSLAWVEKFDAQLKKVERLYTEIDQIRTRRARIDDLVLGMTKAAQRRDRALGRVLAQKKAMRAISAYRAVVGRKAAIDGILNKLAECDRVLARPVVNLSRLAKLREQIKAVESRQRKVASLLFALEQNSWEVKQCRKRIERSEARLKALSGTRCQACGQTIPSSRSRRQTGT